MEELLVYRNQSSVCLSPNYKNQAHMYVMLALKQYIILFIYLFLQKEDLWEAKANDLDVSPR